MQPLTLLVVLSAVAKPEAGTWQVVVEGTKVVADKQPYALVITGHFSSVTKSWGNQPRIMQTSTSSATIHKTIIINRPSFRKASSCTLFGMFTWHTFIILLLIIWRWSGDFDLMDYQTFWIQNLLCDILQWMQQFTMSTVNVLGRAALHWLHWGIRLHKTIGKTLLADQSGEV